ncbi:hypothetical protein DKX38_027273 [Salix brachista]|uniref:PB1 domain-containing protein n=1 Tax=Salix brachista TaxID=2182728 RepID=A0A5N5JGW2_9ROSI|nr:hypothetical protein DKX38_027273 [Salix brachista]
MDPQPPATAPKLRLMCSYGGHIIPNPHTKSLCYSGGDTRLITIPTGTTSATSTNITSNDLTLSSLITHLSSTLKITAPITLKYQLPHHNLDSLISLASDEDVLIMLDEHENNRTPSRLRLFVFPTKPFLSQPELKFTTQLNHPKTETWFVDALKNAKIVNLEGNGNNGSGFCGAESMVLETSSSFGSTSSSVSLSNLGVKGGFVEDNGTGLVDNKVQLSTPEGISSDHGLGTSVCQDPQLTYQDPAGAVTSVESKVSLINPFESERKIPNPYPLIGVEMHNTVPFSGYPVSLQYDQPQQLQFAQTAALQYVPKNTTGIVPLSSYYVMSSPVPQQQVYYPSNQPQPIYLVPVAQPYNLPMQNGLMNTATVDSSRPPIHPDSSMYPAQMAYNAAASLPVAELASQAHRTIPRTSSPVTVPHVENQQQGGGPPQMNHQGQPTCAASMETGNFSKQIDDDPVHAQIYKSQPPPPTLPSQYKTITPATTILLSEAMTQLNKDNIKQQQPRTSQPQ